MERGRWTSEVRVRESFMSKLCGDVGEKERLYMNFCGH